VLHQGVGDAAPRVRPGHRRPPPLGPGGGHRTAGRGSGAPRTRSGSPPSPAGRPTSPGRCRATGRPGQEFRGSGPSGSCQASVQRYLGTRGPRLLSVASYAGAFVVAGSAVRGCRPGTFMYGVSVAFSQVEGPLIVAGYLPSRWGHPENRVSSLGMDAADFRCPMWPEKRELRITDSSPLPPYFRNLAS